MRKFVLILSAVIVFSGTVCLFSSCGHNQVKYDNSINFSEESNHIFKKEKIENLIEDVEHNEIGFDEFKKEFKVKYLRTTEQCYYTVLFCDDGSRLFVFIDSDFELLETLLIDKFKTKSEFENFLSSDSGITYKEVKAFDKSAWDMPVSSLTATIHYVREGIFYVQYNWKTDMIEKADFYENSEVASVVESGVPYILPIDKE